MISELAPAGKYILQPDLMEMHQTSVQWRSALELWKKEVIFFQKLLDQHSSTISDSEIKKQVDHFQHLITYYNGELIGRLRKKVHKHEKNLAQLQENGSVSEQEYFEEHQAVIEEVNNFRRTFYQFKHDYIEFIEKGFSPYALK